MFITEITKDSKYYGKFLNLVEEAQNSVDKLNSNYKTIQKTYHNYETFCMIMTSIKWYQRGEDPVAFFGIQKYKNAVRTFTRYFLSEKYRFYNGTFFHASRYILPWSLRWAKHNGYDFLFVSLQSNLKRKRISQILMNKENLFLAGNSLILKFRQKLLRLNCKLPSSFEQYHLECPKIF